MLDDYGNPVRDMGVTAECAAEQFAGQVAERKARGFVGEEIPTTLGTRTYLQYAGDHSWAQCPTSASRVLPQDPGTYAERCEAVIDASVDAGTELLAQAGDVDSSQVVAVVKSMFCDGTKDSLRRHGNGPYQEFVPAWTRLFGDFAAAWTPSEESAACYEAAMLVAAQQGRQRPVDARQVLLSRLGDRR